jgi:4a-hydroxytetrahydrobiopterin dehydratase
MTDQDGSAWYAVRCIFRCGWPPKFAGRAFEERIRRFEICIDANDPAVLRPFWRTALGYMDEQTPEGAVDLVDPAGVLPTVWFQKVPEVKTSKNRMHLDVSVQTQERERLVDALVALGGTVVATYPRFTTLADPEGN